MTAAGRAYMFLGSTRPKPDDVIHALNRIKGNAMMREPRPVMKSELSRLKANPEFLLTVCGSLKDKEAAGKLRHAHFSAYSLANLNRTSVAIGQGEGPLIPLADAWQRKGASYIIRMLLPGSTNYETARMLESIFDNAGFRIYVSGKPHGLVHETYFRDDNRVYVSMSQFGIAMKALEKIMCMEGRVPKSGVEA